MTDVTPSLEEFRRAYEADDNIWWATACGHHQNLFESACEQLDAQRKIAEQVRALHHPQSRPCGCDEPQPSRDNHAPLCEECRSHWPCDTAVILGTEREMDVCDNCGTETDPRDLSSGLCETCVEEVEQISEPQEQS